MSLFDDLYGDARIVGEGSLAALDENRRSLDGGQNDPGVFVRLWPTSPAAGVAGNSLGFLRYLTRDPATALRVESPLGYSLTLDRSVTAPNAVLGVAFGKPATNRSSWTFMFPGDTIHVPGGFNRFWIFNADDLDKVGSIIPEFKPVGYCAFLVGTRYNGRPPIQDAPRPSARLFGIVNFSDQLYFGTGRLKSMIVQAIPLQASGAQAASTFVTGVLLDSTIRNAFPQDLPKETIDDLTQSNIFQNGQTRYMLGRGPAQMRIPLADVPFHRFQYAVNTLRTYLGVAVASIVFQLHGAD